MSDSHDRQKAERHRIARLRFLLARGAAADRQVFNNSMASYVSGRDWFDEIDRRRSQLALDAAWRQHRARVLRETRRSPRLPDYLFPLITRRLPL